MPCGDQDSKSFRLHVFRGILVSIMMPPTTLTIPSAIRQPEVFIDLPALRTPLGTWEELADKDYMAIVPPPLVLKLSEEHPPGRIQHTLGQLGSRKAAGVERLEAECKEISDQQKTKFVREIRSLMSDSIMNLSHFKSGFGAVATPLLAARKLALHPSQLERRRPVEPGIINRCFIRKGEEGIQPDIAADYTLKRHLRCFSLRQIEFCDQYHEPAAAGIAFACLAPPNLGATLRAGTGGWRKSLRVPENSACPVCVTRAAWATHRHDLRCRGRPP